MAANYVRFYRGSPEAYANLIKKNSDNLITKNTDKTVRI